MVEVGNKDIRIMHLVETLNVGGAERVIVDLVCHMPNSFVSYVCCLQRSGQMASRLPTEVPVVEFLSSGGNDFSLPKKISNFIEENQIDIVHAHNWNTFIESIWGTRFDNSVPVVHTIHGPYSSYSPGFLNFLKKNLRKTIERWLAKKSCRICVVSDAIKDYVLPHLSLPSKKVEVVINGVDTNEIYLPKEQMRRKLGFDDQDIILCFAGRLAKIKNIEYFLSVLVDFIGEVPKGKVLLLGDGEQRSSLETLVAELGLTESVTFLGFQPNVGDYLNCSDIFVLPSYYEGISVALLEAMSAGLPAVATDVGGNGQLVVHGETGYLVPLDQKKVFLDALISLSTDAAVRSRMSVNARERVVDNFSLQNTVNHYLSIYQSCLKGVDGTD